jgi:hypothetical protein
MASPLGQRIKTIFVDEFHDLCAPHPNRRQAWDKACRAIAQIPKQRTFVSATHPPHLHEVFLRKAHIDSRSPIRVIRASTDRPELAYYVLGLTGSHSPTARSGDTLWLSTIGLVSRLIKLLAPDERILVFFEKCEEASNFSNAIGCAVYHSRLATDGEDTKAHNLNRWDSGKSPVMAATTAAGQGVDRPYVKFVLIHRHTFGMVSYAQQGGRPSYVILLRDSRVPPSYGTHPRNSEGLGLQVEEDIKCNHQFADYTTNEGICRRKALLAVMDGVPEGGSFSCLDKAGCNRCDVCDPNGDMLKIVRAAAIPASEIPERPEPARQPSQAARSSSGASRSDRYPTNPPSKPHVTASAATNPWPKVVPNRATGTGRADRGEGGTMTLSLRGSGKGGSSGLGGSKKDAPIATTSIVKPTIVTGIVRWNTTGSNSQPIPSSRRGTLLTQVSPPVQVRPFSQPPSGVVHDRGHGGNASGSFDTRAHLHQQSIINRLGKSHDLDGFLKIIRGHCPVHFATSGELVTGCEPLKPKDPLEPPPRPCPLWKESQERLSARGGTDTGSETTFPLRDYLAFKKGFKYEPYTYCHFCGSPQDYKGSKEAPDCHRTAGYGKKFCRWADFPQVVVFSIWCAARAEDVRKEMVANFQLKEPMSDDEFATWCTTEDKVGGEYTKMMEVFLWYCRKHFP